MGRPNDKEIYENHLKKILSKLSLKELERLSADKVPKDVTRKEAQIMCDLTFKLGEIDINKTEFSDKELRIYTNQAYVWVCFEFFIRLGAFEFDVKTGNLKHTRKGEKIMKLLTKKS